MDDLISRQAAIEMLMNQNVIMDGSEYHNGFNAGVNRAQEVIRNLPTVQPDVPDTNVGKMEPMDVSKTEQADGWMERNKDRILQAGLEGREVEFRIGGRLFAIREKAQ